MPASSAPKKENPFAAFLYVWIAMLAGPTCFVLTIVVSLVL
jgi:hypothetical protein